mmetsp:Transcript_107105/g.313222  ORF Transcript_107105/g.313222 Transcript_107105/m.313222 type:complete len:270 (-) Transcript_107105:509-1318(-)
MPSSFTAFIMRRSFLAFGSAAKYIVQPFRGFLAARISSLEPCLKCALPFATTKTPTSMPFRLSCVSHAFFSVSTSVVSACATFSMSGQSASSMTSHSILPSLSANGSKPCIMGLMISPGEVLTRSFRPSRCSRPSSKPQSASTREMRRSTKRSAPLRLNSLCSCCLITKLTSPVSASGCSSAISRKTTLWPSGEPFWICTSRTSRSCFVLKLFPLPPQAPHADCICWIMGPMRMTSTFTPRPSHSWQETTPLCLSMTCRVMAIFLVWPL